VACPRTSRVFPDPFARTGAYGVVKFIERDDEMSAITKRAGLWPRRWALRDESGAASLLVRRWPERRIVVLTTATLLLLGVFFGSLLSSAPPAAFAVVYVLPVMLIGLELGTYGGIAAALLACGLLLTAWLHKSDLAALDLAASTVSLVAAGWLAGHFSWRMRLAHRRHERLLASGLRLARLECADELPATLAEELEQTVDLMGVEVCLLGASRARVGEGTGESLRLPIITRGVKFGTVTLFAPTGRSFSEEDRTVATKLAQQAAIAADNQRLLVSEREQAVLHAELEHTRDRLATHLRNLGQVLDSQEAERREIARQLHEGVAQAIAGVLLGLQLLERDLDQDLSRHQLEEVRTIARETLSGVRQLAVSVRPPSLDQFGLQAALEGIIERESERRAEQITFSCANCGRDLPPEVQTCVYHVVEDTLQALAGPLEVALAVDHEQLRIAIDGQRAECGPAELDPAGRLILTQARLELLGATWRTTPAERSTSWLTSR
jgi:signal transduction histidine kinase